MQKLNHTRHSLLNVDLQIEKNINYICSLEKLLHVINADLQNEKLKSLQLNTL